MKSLPKSTRELIAACAAHGFEFWAQAPGPAMVWAVGPGQSWHLVKIHRSSGKSSHVCSAWGEGGVITAPCVGHGPAKAYEVPESLEECAALFAPAPEGEEVAA